MHFPPRHLIAAQRRSVHRDKTGAAQIFYGFEIGAIGTGKYHATELVVVFVVATAVVHGGDASHAEPRLHGNVNTGINQEKIHGIGFQCACHFIEIERFDSESQLGQMGAQVFRCGTPRGRLRANTR